ncbi:MAG: ATP-grasp domain-containing protein [Bacteroidia bacterium]|nr:ATP-grasp domain-containing protein [Bacteroidia bacterium]
MKQKITVAVSGLNNIDSPGPGIPVIRALKESNDFEVRIIGLSYETLEPGLYMHHLVDKSYQIPLPSAGIDALLERIHYIHNQEKLDVIIPNFDAELANFMKIENRIKADLGISMFLPTQEQFDERHKANLYEFGEAHGVSVPFSKMMFSTSEISSIATEFTYPMVVKGKFYEAYIAYNAEQVANYFNKLSAKWGLPIIIQEYVFGSEVNVTALGDGQGNAISAVPMRKLFITDKGKAWAGISLDDDELVSIANQVISSSKWRGGMELEFIKTAENKYYLLEINPRFPAWVYLAAGCGHNQPEALVKLALGQNVEPFGSYDIGKMFIRYSYDMIVDLKEFEQISTVGEL